MKIGCHVSIAGGIFNAPANAQDLGCETFQIFDRSPRGGAAPKLTDEIRDNLWVEMKKYGFKEFVVHTPYYVNFGSDSPRIYKGTTDIIREELERASFLGAEYVMTHLGSYKDLGKDRGYEQFVSGLEKVMKGYKGTARLLLENSAGAGQLIGGTFEELGRTLKEPKLKKYEIGICFDTCHAFASGYDLRTPTEVKKSLKEFDKHIGLNKLKVVHCNDSKFGLNEKRDRHEHIGKGKIGKSGFAALVKEKSLQQANWYLETEHDEVKKDIELLKKMRK